MACLQKVRFAEETQATVIKKETKDAEVSTQDPEYDHFMFVRLYSPVGMVQNDIKCSVAFGKQFFKTKRLDNEADAEKDKKGNFLKPFPWFVINFVHYSLAYFVSIVDFRHYTLKS